MKYIIKIATLSDRKYFHSYDGRSYCPRQSFIEIAQRFESIEAAQRAINTYSILNATIESIKE